jgi:hypothetical protein
MAAAPSVKACLVGFDTDRRWANIRGESWFRRHPKLLLTSSRLQRLDFDARPFPEPEVIGVRHRDETTSGASLTRIMGLRLAAVAIQFMITD